MNALSGEKYSNAAVAQSAASTPAGKRKKH